MFQGGSKSLQLTLTELAVAKTVKLHIETTRQTDKRTCPVVSQFVDVRAKKMFLELRNQDVLPTEKCQPAKSKFLLPDEQKFQT